MKSRVCELCNEKATLYCASDSAFLCRNCDGDVHGANFLVSRHVRRTICSKCDGFVGGCVSGAVIGKFAQVCRSCSPNDTDSSPYSSCVSSTDQSLVTSPMTFRSDRLKPDVMQSSGVTAEYSFPTRFSDKIGKEIRAITSTETLSASPARVLGNWSRILGLSLKLRDRVASRAFSSCLTALTVLPYRVALAASFWLSLRLSGDRSAFNGRNLKRLEEISGLSAKLIVRAESGLGRVLRDRKTHRHPQEGWAENSV